MVTGRKIAHLTPEWILRQGVTEYDIYRQFLGEDFTIGRTMSSPMPGRRDSNPSFLIGNRGGFLYHLDMGDSRFRGNAFSFVQQKLMLLNFDDALKAIAKEFNLNTIDYKEGAKRPIFEQPKEVAKPAFIQVLYSTKFTNPELAYWHSYHIDHQELIDNEIYHIEQLLVNRRKAMMRRHELAFGYKCGPKWKVYRPCACKDRKWISSIPIDAVEGLENLRGAKRGIVTKSRKDRIILLKFIPNVCSVQNESMVALNSNTISFLQSECEEVYINYDSDEPGKKNSWAVTTEFGFKHLNVPDKYLVEGIKDFSDLAKVHGLQAVGDYLVLKNII